MSTEYLSNLGSGENGFALSLFHAGDYTLSGATFALAAAPYDVVVLSFLDVDADDLDWLSRLRNIYNDPNRGNALVYCVLYRNGTDCTHNRCVTAMTAAGFPNYNDPADPQYLPFYIHRNGSWPVLPAAPCPAEIYRTGIGSPAGAFTYLLRKTAAGDFRICDKVYPGAPDGAGGDASGASGASLDFTGWTANYGGLEAYLRRRVKDHQTLPAEARLISAPAYARSGGKIGIRFPLHSLGAGTAGNYTVKDGGAAVGGLVSAVAHTTVGVAAYLADTGYQGAELTLGNLEPYDDRTLTLELGAAVTDTAGRALTLAPALSFLVDTLPPRIQADACALDYAAKRITLRFSEGVYAASDGTGALIAADFEWDRVPSPGPIGNLTLISHSPGSDTVVLGFTESTLPQGGETVAIRPKDGASIYDRAGNPMDAGESTGPFALPDLTAPGVPAPACRSDPGDTVFTVEWPAVSGATKYRVSFDGETTWIHVAQGPGTVSCVSPALGIGAHPVAVQAGDGAGAGVGDGDGNWSDSGTAAGYITEAVPSKSIALVLDYSGSMNSPATFGGGTQSKKKWIQDAADAVFNHLMGHLPALYSVGVVCYATKALQALPLTEKSALEADPALFPNALNALPPGTTTAMGKGLAHALGMLDYTASDAAFGALRAIMLFADGQQNVAPKIVCSGSPAATSFTIAAPADPADFPAGMGAVSVSDGKIPIHTWGIGGNTPWLNDLTAISAVTGGQAGADNEIWPDVNLYLTGLVSHIFAGASPQLVRNEAAVYRRGYKQTFHVNAGVSHLAVALGWAGSAELKCVLRKDGAPVHFQKITRKKGLYIGSLYLPAVQSGTADILHYRNIKMVPDGAEGKSLVTLEGPLYGGRKKLRRVISAKGVWTLEVEAVSGTAEAMPFSLSVIVEEKRIRSLPVLLPRLIRPREPLDLGMRFLREGKPLTAAPAVRTIVKRPIGKDITLSLGSPFGFLRGRTAAKGLPVTKKFSATEAAGLYSFEHRIIIDLGKDGIYERVVQDWTFVEGTPRP